MIYGSEDDSPIVAIISKMRKHTGDEGKTHGMKEYMREELDDMGYITRYMEAEAEGFIKAIALNDYKKVAECFKAMYELCKEAEYYKGSQPREKIELPKIDNPGHSKMY